MKLLAILFTLFGIILPAHAYEMAITGGAQTTDVDVESGSGDPDGGTGFYGGVLGFMEIQDKGYFRVGALLSKREYSVKAGSITLDSEMLSIDVPITYMFMFNEMAGIFGGLKLGLNLSDDCSRSDSVDCDTKAESLHYAGEVGGHFRFVPDFGLEISLNLGLSDIAKDVEWKNGIGVGMIYLF